MNIIVAPDSFKGSLSAVEAAVVIIQGVRALLPDAEIVSLPLADGGEGTVEALVTATRGRYLTATVKDPLGLPVEARFGVLGDDVTGVIEMAAASGLTLIPPDKRNPEITTTYGTGQLLLAAREAGCTRLIIGLGGSATNDGGAGMAQALGAHLLDAEGKELPPGGAALERLEKIVASGVDPRLANVTILIASDVSNPLCGPDGASAVYGPQKGATPEMVERLDRALAHYAEVIERDLRLQVRDLPGAGAAGGLGAGLVAFCRAEMRAGISVVLDALGFDDYLDYADLVITGEGKIDSQTAFGKALTGVGRMAKRHGVPVVALAGAVGEEAEQLQEFGLTTALGITPGPMPEEQAMAQAADLLQAATERALRLILIGREVGDGRWRLSGVPAAPDREPPPAPE
jgi:glycerate kinase